MTQSDVIQVNYIPTVGEFTQSEEGLATIGSGLSPNAVPASNASPEHNEQSNEIIANRGRIGGWFIGPSELYNEKIRIHSDGYIASGKTLFDNTQTGWILGVDPSTGVAKFYIGDTNNYMNWTGTALNIVGATVSGLAVGSEAAIQAWTYSGAFSVTDLNTIAWATGTLTLMDTTAYSITGSNTGNMAAFTYIYLDVAVSTTAFQVSTSFTAGSGKILIATAQNGASEAAYLMMGGAGTHNIDGGNIAAASIIASHLSVTQLSAITANMGTITAGTITIDTSGYVRGGQTDYNTGTGFFLGYSGAAYKFSIGVPTGDYLTWDGSNLTISAPLVIDFSMTAGTAITVNDALSFSPNILDLDNIITTVGDELIATANANSERADSFVATYAATTAQVIVRIKKVGTPAGALTLSIHADNAGDPAAATLGSTTIAVAAVSTSYTDITKVITGLSLTAGNTYWLKIGGLAIDAVNYFVWARDGSGSHKVFDNGGAGVWSADSDGDLIYSVRLIGGTGVANKVFLGTALIQDSADKFLGFALSTVAAAATVKVRTDGKITTSGLTATSTYFLSDTHGVISTTAGTVSKKVGRALSTTDFQIKYTL